MYVFQTRIPSHINSKTPLIRQSTGTYNRRLALKIARNLLITLEQQWYKESPMVQQVLGKTLNLSLDDIVETPRLKLESAKSPPLSELIDKWIDGKTLRASSRSSYNDAGKLFVRILAENNITKLSQLTPSAVVSYRDVLKKIPSNINKRFPDSSVKEVLGKEPLLSPSAVANNVGFIRNFLTWLDDDRYIDTREHLKPLKGIKKPKKGNRNQFSSDQLTLLFTHSKFTELSPSMQWCMRVAVFTGARLGEILQLHKMDIQNIDGVWCIVFKEEADKQLKEETSAGVVPIAQQLIDIGFLQFVDNCKTTRLFPDEPRDKHGRFSNFTKRFNTYRTNIGVNSTDTVFHSFRHTMRTVLVELECPEAVIDSILRHASKDRSIGAKVYSHSQRIKEKQKWLNKVQYQFFENNSLK